VRIGTDGLVGSTCCRRWPSRPRQDPRLRVRLPSARAIIKDSRGQSARGLRWWLAPEARQPACHGLRPGLNGLRAKPRSPFIYL